MRIEPNSKIIRKEDLSQDMIFKILYQNFCKHFDEWSVKDKSSSNAGRSWFIAKRKINIFGEDFNAKMTIFKSGIDVKLNSCFSFKHLFKKSFRFRTFISEKTTTCIILDYAKKAVYGKI